MAHSGRNATELENVDPVVEAREHTIAIELFGRTMLCLDLPGLIRAKRAAGRPRDLETIAELEALREEG
jgi:hypothetical protein